MIFKEIKAKLKDVDTVKRIVTGHFAHFNNVDSDREVIRPGAFLKSIQEKGPKSSQSRIKHLLDHSRQKGVGILQELKEDTEGLYYESRAGRWAAGEDFLLMAQDGLITEHSIGFDYGKGNSVEIEGKWAYELLEVDLWEGSSLQCWGANPMTPLMGIKSSEAIIERFKALSHALKHGTYSDECFIQLEKEFDEISAILKAKTTESGKTTQPDSEKGKSEFYKSLSEIFKG